MKAKLQPAAQKDIQRQIRYLLEKASVAIALRFQVQVEAAANKVSERSTIGTPVHLSRLARFEIRSSPVATFPSIRLYYTLTATGIRILRVLHGKRDIQEFLTEPSSCFPYKVKRVYGQGSQKWLLWGIQKPVTAYAQTLALESNL